MRNGSDTPNRRLTEWRRFLKREAQRQRVRPADSPTRNLRLSLFDAPTLAALPDQPFDWRDFERRALFFAQSPVAAEPSPLERRERQQTALAFFAELYSELISPSGSFRLSALIARSNSVSDRVDPSTGESVPIRPLNAIAALLEPFVPDHSSGDWSIRIRPICHGLAEALSQEPQGRLLHFWRDLCKLIESSRPLAESVDQTHPRQELLFLMGVLTGNEAFRTALLLPAQRELDEREEPLAISGLHTAITALATASPSAPAACVSMAAALFERAERLGLLPIAPTRQFLSGQIRETSLARRVVEALIMAERRGGPGEEAIDRAQDDFARLLCRHGADFLPDELDPELGNPLSARSQRFSAALRAFKDASAIQEAMGAAGSEVKAARSRL